jgi:hypothetical protein
MEGLFAEEELCAFLVYFLISQRATVPGRKRCGFFAVCAVASADLGVIFVASCIHGAVPPVRLLAFCFMRAVTVSFPSLLIYGEFVSFVQAPL